LARIGLLQHAGGHLALQTPLHALHLALGARMVDFGGWDMPVAYGSQLEEHHAVRTSAGVFDVSHMCICDLRGARVRSFLRYLLANDVARLQTPGKALYSCMLNESGGVVDDLIVYYMNEHWFRLVVNAGTRSKDMAWISSLGGAFDVRLSERRELAMLAVQGPEARDKLANLLSPEDAAAALTLRPFVGGLFADWFIARTGYTGEDGFEIMLPSESATELWNDLNELGVISCGLGARDTLRLEAGMNLYGNDMDEATNPLESGLAWTVSMEMPDRNFVGRAALEELKAAGLQRKQVGLLLGERAVMRAHQPIIVDNINSGEITSGTFSPTLARSIALARVPRNVGEQVQVDIRGKLHQAQVVKPPFVRHGKIMVAI
jgi:aminomethyltransferase